MRTVAEPWCRGELLLGAGASGPLVRLVEPLSFWGGVDAATGVIVDRHHPQVGLGLAGTALLTGTTRGSSSTTSTFLECVRRSTAPALVLLTEPDSTLVVAVAAAWEIYGSGPSVVLLADGPPATAATRVSVDGAGCVRTYAGTVHAAVERTVEERASS